MVIAILIVGLVNKSVIVPVVPLFVLGLLVVQLVIVANKTFDLLLQTNLVLLLLRAIAVEGQTKRVIVKRVIELLLLVIVAVLLILIVILVALVVAV